MKPSDQTRHDDDQTIRNFYDNIYYQHVDSDPKPSGHLVRLAKHLGIGTGAKVLDVGCGTGAWLRVMSSFGAMPHGIDISATAVAACRAAVPMADLHCAPAEPLPWPDGVFDFVTCLGSLEHFRDPLAALRDMVRVAKPDARVLLLVPNADFLTRKLGCYGGTNQAQVRELVLSMEEWETLFGQAGLQVSKRWRDLHVLSWYWITKGRWYRRPLRLAQAVSLCFWPLRWQYQIYHLCTVRKFP